MDVDSLKELLLQMPNARLASNNKEVIFRCPYCGDSRKDIRAAHFYVQLPYNDLLPLFYCFRASCQSKGILTADKLMDWGLYDQDAAIELTKYNRHAMSMSKNKKYKESQAYRLNNTFITDNELSKIKLKYINTRLGLDLTYNDLLNKKIVLNLRDLLDSNNISEYTRDPRIVNELDESFIGFISQDNAFVNLKNLRQGKVNRNIDMRYVNYNVFNKLDNTQRYYTLPSSIDLNNPNRIKIHIAEGPFDILSIYYNVTEYKDHSIYSAILGGGYLGLVKHFIITMKLINVEFHIYMDNDIDDKNYVINNINSYLKILNIPLYIHSNMYPEEKDFGVKRSNIDDRVYLVR